MRNNIKKLYYSLVSKSNTLINKNHVFPLENIRIMVEIIISNRLHINIIRYKMQAEYKQYKYKVVNLQKL